MASTSSQPPSKPSEYLLTELSGEVHPLRLKSWLRILGATDQTHVGPDVALTIWLLSVLEKRHIITQEAANFLLETWCEELKDAGKRIALNKQQNDARLVLYCTVFDGTFVALSGQNHCLDLRSGELLSSLPRPPLESVAYNLTNLYFFHAQRLQEKRKSNADRNTIRPTV